MKLFTSTKSWPIRVVKHRVKFRKAFPLNELDKIILSIMSNLNDSVLFTELGILLGFAVENIPAQNIFYDIAEENIFNSLLENLIKYHLIEIEYDTENMRMVNTTTLGRIGRESNYKYWFYEGIITINEHQLVHVEETLDDIFPFYKLSVFSEIILSSETPPVEYDFIAQKNNLLLQKAISNFQTENPLNEGIEIQWVETIVNIKGREFINTYSKIDIIIELSLLNILGNLTIETKYKLVTIPEFNKILNSESNSVLLRNYILELRYGLYLNDAIALTSEELRDYADCVIWEDILLDSRIVWNNALLILLAAENIATNAIWNIVILKCPENILKNNIYEYNSFWDWSKMTSKLDVLFITANINKYPWDFDYLIERVDAQELENLLLKISDPDAISDWTAVTGRVSSSFINKQIGNIPFDLKSITRLEDFTIQELVLLHPNIEWDWFYIISEWPLSFILGNFEIINRYISLEIYFKRLLSNSNDFELAFNDILSRDYITSNICNISEKIGISQNVILNKSILRFLSENNLLFWGNFSFPGVECNKNFIWYTELFNTYNHMVKAQAGYDQVSRTIQNISIITENQDFPWNYDILSHRKDLVWSIDFIIANESNLDVSSLIYNLSTDLVSQNLLFFITWFKEKESIDIITDYINISFSVDLILQEEHTLRLQNIDIDWGSILKNQPNSNLNELILQFNKNLIQIPSSATFRTEVSKICNIEFILQNFTFHWDWIVITKSRISQQMFDEEDFIGKYGKYLFWPHIIEKYCNVEQLLHIEKLTTIAEYVMYCDLDCRKQTWSIITAKIPPIHLHTLLNETAENDIFQWDWNYISSSKNTFIEHRFLSTHRSSINWKLLSENPALSIFFHNNKEVYSNVDDWLLRTFEYLDTYSDWHFGSLSSVNNLTWHTSIIKKYKEQWNWTVLSQQSNFFTNYTREDKTKRYNELRLKEFAQFIDWKKLSMRYDVTITIELLEKFVGQDWDWTVLSSHPKFKLSRLFLKKYLFKDWDFKALSSNEHLSIDKEFILEFSEQDWDYQYLSSNKWIDNDVLISTPDRCWDWPKLSVKKDLIFDNSLINVFVGKVGCDWSAILNSDNLHITDETMATLYNNNYLDDAAWCRLSSNANLNLFHNKSLLEKYKEQWDWSALIEDNKIDINDITTLHKYKEFIDWKVLTSSPNFLPSTDVLSQFKNYIDWKYISVGYAADFDSLHLFKSYFDWELISKNTSIAFSSELIGSFKEYWNYYYLINNIALSLPTKEYVLTVIASIPELDLYFKLMEQNVRWAGYIYHFTHISNAAEIIKDSKILSRNKAAYFSDASGSVVERRNTAHEFARFYFRPQTPTQFYNESLGVDYQNKNYHSALRLGLPKCPIPVFFRFDLQEVILKMREKCYMSNGNMQTNRAIVKPIVKMLSKFNFNDIYSTITNTTDDDYRTYINFSQQEFLVKDEFDFSLLEKFNIIVKNEVDKHELIRRIGKDSKFLDRIVVDDSTRDLFHNRNKEINCNFENNILEISTDYKGDGNLSGVFKIEFPANTQYELLDGDIIDATTDMITAYPKINIRFLNNTKCKVYFRDSIKKIDWQLYNWN